MIIKILYGIASLIMVSLIFYSYHQQIAGHPHERVECNKIGGILWHTLDQQLICIKPSER